tara:strand:- start:405 stop:1298 length:894 start_codon:yes stop_codon:yes gene_type:complete
MDIKQIMSFIKIEHTLFSLPFIIIGYFVAVEQFYPADEMPLMDLAWVLVAAVGARGLAMTLNRIIDKDIDAENPRTAQRHLASGKMSLSTAWMLAIIFLIMLLVGAGMLNEVALMMSWLPVLTFVIYPYTKRFTWLCHLWLGLCLGLAPAGAWVAIAGDFHGWQAITGTDGFGTGLLWYPTIFFISLGVTLWITAFDINYARMDVESDRKHGINSFPARFSEKATTRTSIQLTLAWFACFALADPMSEFWFLGAALVMAIANAYVMMKNNSLNNFQDVLFKVSVSTGWVLIIPFLLF